ncbi:MAG: LemA family protein, partial [Desulfobacterales bacterium]|nr:LemA family protein [Desulfobacterales bacterium]
AHNVKIRSFPTNIMAGMFGFTGAEFFKAPAEAKEVPKVEFK